MSLVSKPFSPEKMQLLFTPLMLASEPSGTLTSFMLPVEILRKIGRFASVEAMRNLIATCKYIRNQPNTWFLQVLASEYNPDRATSGFIIDAIGNEGNTCLWCNAKFFIKDYDIPKEISIHLFANAIAEKISSDEVRSMIIQVSGLSNSSNPSDPHRDIRKFLTFIFSKVSFKKLKCLMFCGIELSEEFSQEIGTLNLFVFHMRNFRCHTSVALHEFFRYFNSLETLYVVHPDEDQDVFPPEKLERIVIYCPKSSRNYKLGVYVGKCHALKEM